MMNDWIRHIVNQSSGISERLSGEFSTDIYLDQASTDEVHKRLEQWCNSAAKGNWDHFSKRLAMAGMTMDDAKCAVRPTHLIEGVAFPEWTVTLQAIATSIARADMEYAQYEKWLEHSQFDSDRPIAFEHLFLPVISVARRLLKDRAGDHADVLSPTGWQGIERSLLHSLSQLCWQSLELEFSVFRSGSWAIPGDRTEYIRFISEMFRGKFITFLQEYCVLAYLIATTVDSWVNALAEFLVRYATDKPWLDNRIVAGQQISTIAKLQMELSDLHNSGRRVIVVLLESGGQLVYKPKSLGLDMVYSDLLEWLSDHGAPYDLLAASVVDHGTYGWQAFIEHVPCVTDDEIIMYYRRAGALLCVAYMLGGTDLHEENVIAHGSYPVLVDVETLLQPFATTYEDATMEKNADDLAYASMDRSVLRTVLLPKWLPGKAEEKRDVSGFFGGQFDQNEPVTARGLLHVNTDAMKSGDVSYTLPMPTNIPFIEGRSLGVKDYNYDFAHGFHDMYMFFMQQQGALLAWDGPLSAFKNQPSRFIFRTTTTYQTLLENSWRPGVLRNGVDRDIQLDKLVRILTVEEENAQLWPLVRYELEAMKRLDIPYFRLFTDEHRLMDCSEQDEPQLFSVSGYDDLMMRVKELSEQDCRFQISLIRGTLYAKFAGKTSHHSTASESQTVHVQESDYSDLQSNEAWLISVATSIADRLNREAITAQDGTRTWIAPAWSGKYPRLRPLGHDLYEGHCGIALFYAALAKTTGKESYRVDAMSTLLLLRNKIRTNDLGSFNRYGIGGFVGLGSIIYALVRIGQLIHESELLNEARTVASWITESRIETDEHFDVLHGAAGSILALLVLYDATRDPSILSLAVLCGEHIIRNRTLLPSGYRVWTDNNGKTLAGFSHGAAGIAYALLRLYSHIRDERFVKAAEEAIRYERSIFVSVPGMWPDLRVAPGEEGLTDAWCHGAAGIGLARLAGLPILDSEEIHLDIDAAIRAVLLGMKKSTSDYLCCGAMGRVELLLAASLRQNQAQLVQEANFQASMIAERYRRRR